MAAPQSAVITDLRWHFLEDVFLSNTKRDFMATRGGRKVYVPTITDGQRWTFQETFYAILRDLARLYASTVEEEAHIQNINAICRRLADSCGAYLNENTLTFGVAQKP